MRRIATLMATANAVLLTTATRAYAQVQDAKIEIKTTDGHGEWYTQPVWIVIGIIVLVLILVLIAMAGRRHNTTVVK
jgi:hypothetical protein